jgi:hypothetical protein
MTRNSRFAIAAGMALISLSFCADAFAMATNGPAGHTPSPSPGPAAPSASHGNDTVLHGCRWQADQFGLTGVARHDFYSACERGEGL